MVREINPVGSSTEITVSRPENVPLILDAASLYNIERARQHFSRED